MRPTRRAGHDRRQRDLFLWCSGGVSAVRARAMTAAGEPRTGAVMLHPANLLTLTRLALAPLLFWLILDAPAAKGASWAAFGLGVAMAGTDFFDGRVARRSGVETRAGAFLDPLADKVVVLGAGFCLVSVERYWWLPVTIIAVRELGITAWRTRWVGEGVVIPARRSAKYKTFVQGTAMALALLPPLQDADAFLAAALWVAVAFTVVTGAQYLFDARRAGVSGLDREGRR